MSTKNNNLNIERSTRLFQNAPNDFTIRASDSTLNGPDVWTVFLRKTRLIRLNSWRSLSLGTLCGSSLECVPFGVFQSISLGSTHVQVKDQSLKVMLGPSDKVILKLLSQKSEVALKLALQLNSMHPKCSIFKIFKISQKTQLENSSRALR